MIRHQTKLFLAAALSIGSTQIAHADGVTIAGNLNITLPEFANTSPTFVGGGYQTLSLSSSMLGFLDSGSMQLASFGAQPLDVTKDGDGYYTKAIATALTSTVNLNANTFTVDQVTGVGGLTITAPFHRDVSSGGSFAVGDWHVDMPSRSVSATVIGANGVGTIASMPLWTATDTQISVTKIGDWDGNLDILDYSVTLSGLTLTDAGRTTMAQSLGLLTLGQSAFDQVNNVGTLTAHVQITGKLSDFTTAVPEPSTWAMLSLGLMGVGWTARRRRGH